MGPVKMGKRIPVPPPPLSRYIFSPGSLTTWFSDLKAVPAVPKALALAGVLPFWLFSPPIAHHFVNIPLIPLDFIENAALYQLAYGAHIVTFLGAVNWGVALASPVKGDPRDHQEITGGLFIFSVLPMLIAWQVSRLDPQSGSICLCVLLPLMYLFDKLGVDHGVLPAWYGALRKPVTWLAWGGVCLTASYYYHLTSDFYSNFDWDAFDAKVREDPTTPLPLPPGTRKPQ